MALCRTICVCGIVVVAAGAWAQPVLPPVEGNIPLRYALQPGEHLVYERRALDSTLETGQEQQRIVDRIRLWCLAREGDENLLLLEQTRSRDGRVEPLRGAVFYLDQRGRRRVPDVVQTRLAELEPAFEFFPELRPALQPDPTWTTTPDLYGQRWRCTRIGPDPRFAGHVRVEFVVEDPTGVANFVGQSQSGSFWFDREAGIVTRVESQRDDRHAGLHTKAITVLRLRKRCDKSWCVRRADEVQRYLRTLRHEDRYLQQIVNEPTRLEQTFRQLNRLWEEFMVDLKRDEPSPLRQLGAVAPQQLAAQRERLEARAWLGQRWLGQTAADWSLQDPAGQTISSEALRDRYVVECFWSAESLGSLRAFETLRRLQRELADKPVHVVCLNLDRDVELARRAAQRCGKDLTTVLVGPPVVGEAPPELPVFRVVDRRGKIRGVFIGWRPSLADELAALLGE
ncbi:MAG TPA: hypothetical protein VM487_11220 [Phycisphaerae bacterium]|nr:hypothetical protein [Phycisphaerae bacterium]